MNNNRLYLTGFMGSGKSTIAPILANTLGFSCIDMDKAIEDFADKNISEIFSDFGEAYFRELEESMLQKISRQENCIISLGGGTIASGNNLNIVKSTGILIYLKTSVEQIMQRLKFKTDRPLIRSELGIVLDESHRFRHITNLLTKREPYYNQAHLTIPTDNRKVGSTVDDIVEQLKQLGK